MKKTNWTKILGVGLAVAGAVVSVVSNIVADKNLDITVAEKVAEALQKD